MTAAERKAAQLKKGEKDKLNRAELEASYKSAVGVIYAVPELRQLFEEALNNGWAADRVTAAVQSSDWYRANNEYFRLAWAKQNVGGADWVAAQEIARLAVEKKAVAAGSQKSPEELEALTQRYIFEGWGEAGREALLDKALSESLTSGTNGFMRGAAGDLQTKLKDIAVSNGLPLSKKYYESAARSIASGLTTENDWIRDLRSQAASLWPSYAEKINAGLDVDALASGYVNTMADTLEIDPNEISLNDPYIRQALSNYDEKGNPMPMGLWEFGNKLRSDPRWMGTKQATDRISDIATTVLKTFGLRG
jgi:hypothetical protein